MRNNDRIPTFVTILALVAMSCGLQIVPSNGSQVPPSSIQLQNSEPTATLLHIGPSSQPVVCPKDDLSPIGILRSTDRGGSWTSLGNACIKGLAKILPADMTGFVSGSHFVLYFVDLLSLNKPIPQILYRITSEDGVNFETPWPAYTQTLTMVDPFVLQMANDSYRLYVPSDQEGTISAASRDGLNFSREAGMRTKEGGMPGALLLPDNRVRLFLNGGYNGQEGIFSKISSDGLNFTEESGMRILVLAPMIVDDPQPIRLNDGSYLMLYQVHDRRNEAPGKFPWEHTELHLATSPDGYNWTANPVIIGYGGTSCVVEITDGTLYIYYGGPSPTH